eukprot:scaffold15609_cov19-Tisochrysis_lutea.AAC.1
MNLGPLAAWMRLSTRPPLTSVFQRSCLLFRIMEHQHDKELVFLRHSNPGVTTPHGNSSLQEIENY